MNHKFLIAGILSLVFLSSTLFLEDKDNITLQSTSITPARHGTDNDPSLKPQNQVTKHFGSKIENEMKDIYNAKGKFFENIAKELNINSSDAAAITKVESSGHGFSSSSGLMIIRFENYHFYKYYTNHGKDSEKLKIFNQHFKFDAHQSWKGHMFRKDVNGEWETFHGHQQKEWEVLQFAQSLDDTSALMSASYGLGQIMGFNFSVCGYRNVQAMFIAFSGSIQSQLSGMFNFIKHNRRCIQALEKSPTDYTGFASCYNGSGQSKTYGEWISSAAKAYSSVLLEA